jgi:hypothetical protein
VPYCSSAPIPSQTSRFAVSAHHHQSLAMRRTVPRHSS